MGKPRGRRKSTSQARTTRSMSREPESGNSNDESDMSSMSDSSPELNRHNKKNQSKTLVKVNQLDKHKDIYTTKAVDTDSEHITLPDSLDQNDKHDTDEEDEADTTLIEYSNNNSNIQETCTSLQSGQSTHSDLSKTPLHLSNLESTQDDKQTQYSDTSIPAGQTKMQIPTESQPSDSLGLPYTQDELSENETQPDTQKQNVSTTKSQTSDFTGEAGQSQSSDLRGDDDRHDSPVSPDKILAPSFEEFVDLYGKDESQWQKVTNKKHKNCTNHQQTETVHSPNTHTETNNSTTSPPNPKHVYNGDGDWRYRVTIGEDKDNIKQQKCRFFSLTRGTAFKALFDILGEGFSAVDKWEDSTQSKTMTLLLKSETQYMKIQNFKHPDFAIRIMDEPQKKLYGVLDGLHPEKFPIDKIRVQSLSFKGKIPTEKEKENVTIVRHIKGVVTHNGKVILNDKGQELRKDTSKVVFTFQGSTLPDSIEIEGVGNIPVQPYRFRPQPCKKCLKYNHNTRNCKAKSNTCGHCGETGHSISHCTKANDQSKAYCIHCKTQGHRSISKECPEFKKEQHISSCIMAFGGNRHLAAQSYAVKHTNNHNENDLGSINTNNSKQMTEKNKQQNTDTENNKNYDTPTTNTTSPTYADKLATQRRKKSHNNKISQTEVEVLNIAAENLRGIHKHMTKVTAPRNPEPLQIPFIAADQSKICLLDEHVLRGESEARARFRCELHLEEEQTTTPADLQDAFELMTYKCQKYAEYVHILEEERQAILLESGMEKGTIIKENNTLTKRLELLQQENVALKTQLDVTMKELHVPKQPNNIPLQQMQSQDTNLHPPKRQSIKITAPTNNNPLILGQTIQKYTDAAFQNVVMPQIRKMLHDLTNQIMEHWSDEHPPELMLPEIHPPSYEPHGLYGI